MDVTARTVGSIAVTLRIVRGVRGPDGGRARGSSIDYLWLRLIYVDRLRSRFSGHFMSGNWEKIPKYGNSAYDEAGEPQCGWPPARPVRAGLRRAVNGKGNGWANCLMRSAGQVPATTAPAAALACAWPAGPGGGRKKTLLRGFRSARLRPWAPSCAFPRASCPAWSCGGRGPGIWPPGTCPSCSRTFPGTLRGSDHGSPGGAWSGP